MIRSVSAELRLSSGRRPALGPACPSCGERIPADAKWCPSCRFTGGDTMKLFPESPPPLLPVLDAAGIWSEADVRVIEIASGKMRRRYPQFHWHVCTVVLPPETSLSVFGFWLLNACPFYVNESAEDRAWSVLLVINTATGEAAVVPGYSAEHWLDDEDWKKVLSSMGSKWKAGETAQAVVRFFRSCTEFLDHSWKVRGVVRRRKSKSKAKS